MPLVYRKAKDTLTAVELNRGDNFIFILASGKSWEMDVGSTHAEVTQCNLRQIRVAERPGKTTYLFNCRVKINGVSHTLNREVATQKSFYEPWLIDGVYVWLDAVADIFNFLNESHGDCRPKKHVRFALQDASQPFCPEPLHPWCPLPPDGLKIEDCYTGECCWLGAFQGADAHGGLDINHPAGTPLWAPLAMHDQFYFNSLEMGHNNNRWRGIHHWPNGSQWIFQAHHLITLHVPQHVPISKGELLADTAGVLTYDAEHTHFIFKIHDEGETIPLDPWILFRQMYIDQARR